jgi:hypothetical protein
LVARITPPAPTATQALVDAHETARRSTLVPDVCDDQLTPPLVVRTIVPLAPTAQHELVEPGTHEMPYSAFVAPETCGCQVVPALPVSTTVPASPTAQQLLTVEHDTLRSALIVPDV